MHPIVYIVDDDRDVRSSIHFMLGTAGWEPRAFPSGFHFLGSVDQLEPGCVLLDIRMPGMSGVEVLEELQEREVNWPVVMMTGHGEVPLAVQTMRLGAIDFLEKPFDDDALQSCLGRAWELLQKQRGESARSEEARARIDRLTQREREVLEGLIAGLSNKLIAHQLGISLRTAEMHRANLMQRLRAKSLAEALRLASEAGVQSPPVPAQRVMVAAE